MTEGDQIPKPFNILLKEIIEKIRGGFLEISPYIFSMRVTKLVKSAEFSWTRCIELSEVVREFSKITSKKFVKAYLSDKNIEFTGKEYVMLLVARDIPSFSVKKDSCARIYRWNKPKKGLFFNLRF